MKKISILCFVVIPFLSIGQTSEKSVVAANGERIGFLEFRPSDYSGAKHPLIIFLHGIGEKGNGTSELRKVHCCGIPSYIRRGNKMRFSWQGKTESFVVLSPQLSKKYNTWQPFYTDELIKYAKANLNIDPNRIFVTGLSMGGGGTWNFASSSQARAEQLAGIAPVVAPCTMSNGCNIAKASLPVLAIHVWDDKDAPAACTVNAISAINSCSPSVTPNLIMYSNGGHYVWVKRAFDTAHDYQNPNMFEWFLAQNKTFAPNKKPVARAGKDQSATTSDGTVLLSAGASSDPDGSVVRYIWTKLSGPAVGLSGTSTANLKLTDIKSTGNYKFQLKVVDNRAEWSLDTVVVNVAKGDGTPNDEPIARAGSDQTLELPGELSLDGSDSEDPDGSLMEFEWSKVDGPEQYQFGNASNAATSVGDLVAGVYTFRLTVTDNRGATATDEVKVTVRNAGDQEPDPDTIPDVDSIPGGPSNSPLPGRVVKQDITIYPNPAANDVVLRLDTYERGDAIAVIYDNMGRIVRRISFIKSQNKFLQRLPTAGLGKGMFYVDVMVNRKAKFSTSFIKR